MRISLLILTILIGVSCTGKSDSTSLHSAPDAGAYTKFVNQKNMPSDPNLTIDKTIINHKYPIEIALYKDGRFFYDLPNLGTGKGKWKYEDGKIELRASRKIFDMYIEVYGADASIEAAAIQFNDRFGSNTLKMESKNL